MGGIAPKKNKTSPKRAKKVRKVSRAKPAKKTEPHVVAPDSYEESMTSGDETYVNHSGTESEAGTPPLRPKLEVRHAARRASLSIGAVARREATMAAKEVAAKEKASKRQEKQGRQEKQAGPRTLPGSLDQRRRKQLALEKTEDLSNASLLLQTKAMADGTLLQEWKKPTFRPGKVSRIVHGFDIYTWSLCGFIVETMITSLVSYTAPFSIPWSRLLTDILLFRSTPSSLVRSSH